MDIITDPTFGEEIITFPCGDGYGACYRDDEMDDFGGFAVVLSLPCRSLAAAELVRKYPREVAA